MLRSARDDRLCFGLARVLVLAACLLALTPGKTLTIRAGVWGAWCYLACGGRFDLPLTLGALATPATGTKSFTGS